MDYVELKISMPQEKVDLVSTFLVTGGYDTFEVCDYSDMLENAGEMFYDYIEDELLEKKDQPPCIKFYCEPDGKRAGEIRAFVEGVVKNLGWDDVVCEQALVTGSNWDTKWKEFFFPFPVGEKLFIKPGWETVSEEVVGSRRVIEIDPAAAFGTGTHATTRLCLEGMEKILSGGETVLDMGCGSGILGIGAVKLGAAKVVAVDIDEHAARTAAENFHTNQIGEEQFEVLCGDVLSDPALCEKMGKGFDLICANIVAQIIKDMAPLLFAALRPGGSLLASGILVSRKEEVKKALLAAGFVCRAVWEADDWVCMELTREA